ncbi:flagellar hook-basal body complex protein [Pontibacterium sp. N1Y112]|uniref:Flagellar hook protein FlgE n=1 Tax=Pontibacterium sinense TaxID=2781979 RepID=A0A8J7K977_9GAMM|nr:flagellar hook-basal body complex protein [Pontibacterium sinense]MBE9396361.1 flagellar hook-basal body complex protein [Pontibacterium sinense]
MAGFNTAITGLKSAQTDLDVTGNNIANASTVGFKASRTQFGDLYATAVVGAGSSNTPGAGVTVSGIAQDFSSGTVEFTNSNLDLAINGSGFFQLDDGKGGVTYTRAGSFELDKEGFIVSKNGKNLQGYGLDAKGNQLPLRDLAVDQKESLPHATENIGLSFNIDSTLDSSKLAAVYDKNNANSFSYTSTIETFDSLGNAQNIKFNFAEQRPVREVYTFQPTQAAVGEVPVDDSGDPNAKNARQIDISGVGIKWEEVLPALTPKVYKPDAASIDALEVKDPRIDADTIRFSVGAAAPATAPVLFMEFNSEASATGDLIIAQEGTGELKATNLADGEPATRKANKIQSFVIHDDSGIATPVKFTAAGKLANETTLTFGGVSIPLDTKMGPDDVGEAIANAQQKIIELNPKIEAVQYNTASNTVYVTWTAEAGEVDDLIPTDTNSLLTGASTSPEPASQKGDNSFMSVYRMYSYLNDSQQLNVGKRVDPGESGFDAKKTEVGPVIIKFDTTNGTLKSINGETIASGGAVPKLTILGADPANPDDTLLPTDTDNLKGLQLDITGASQFSSASIVKKQTQDGYTKGDLIGVSFEETGQMVASFSNGQRQNLGLVAIATFENQSGLQPSGDTEWLASLTSGQAILNPPGTGLNGTLRSAALEQSNVDLSEELVSLIEAQRNFQANSKTLETLNTVTQNILQI